MAKGYKIFPRSKAFRDNWDETFSKKPKVDPYVVYLESGPEYKMPAKPPGK